MYVHQIATHWSCCLSTVEKVLSHHRTTGLVRESVQGRGKRDDPRWIVAGPRGPGNLRELEMCRERARADEFLRETHERLQQEGSDDVARISVSAFKAALQEKLHFTTKRLSAVAADRDPAACDNNSTT